jgi:hypothetical protein
MVQYFDYVGDYLKGEGPDKFTYYEVIVDDFTLPINTYNSNWESEDITINKGDLLAFGSDSIEIKSNNPCGEIGLCNIGLHKPYNKDWNYKIFQVGLSKEFFERNTRIVNNITQQYKRDKKINQILN